MHHHLIIKLPLPMTRNGYQWIDFKSHFSSVFIRDWDGHKCCSYFNSSWLTDMATLIMFCCCCCFAWFYVVVFFLGGGSVFFKLFSLFFFPFFFWLAFAEEVVDMTIRSLVFCDRNDVTHFILHLVKASQSVTHLLYALDQKTSVFGRLFSPLIYVAKQRF